MNACMSLSLQNYYEFGTFRLVPAERKLLHNGVPLLLEPRVFNLLVLLVQQHGHLVTKEKLLESLWPNSFVEESNLTRNVSILRKVLERSGGNDGYVQTVPKHGYRFVAEVRVSGTAAAISALPMRQFIPAGGAVALDSQFYITRTTDVEFGAALKRQDSIVLVKGARQVGKTSLLARGMQQARDDGAQVIVTDFQNLNTQQLSSAENLLRTLAESIADQLDLVDAPQQDWNPHLSAGINFERFLRKQVFPNTETPLVWGLDEVDRLFACDFGSEIFGLFRSWHNKRALDPQGHWQRFSLAIVYATEAHLFITDLNQSPFNVGTRLQLEDFALTQVADLNQRYGAPLRSGNGVTRYFSLVGGHPYLAHRGISEMALRHIDFDEVETQAVRNDGLFGDHLRRLLLAISQDEALLMAVRNLLQGHQQFAGDAFYRLRSAGVICGDTPREASFRCQLYQQYLQRNLL